MIVETPTSGTGPRQSQGWLTANASRCLLALLILLPVALPAFQVCIAVRQAPATATAKASIRVGRASGPDASQAIHLRSSHGRVSKRHVLSRQQSGLWDRSKLPFYNEKQQMLLPCAGRDVARYSNDQNNRVIAPCIRPEIDARQHRLTAFCPFASRGYSFIPKFTKLE
jgi:hypothetical protein